MPNALNFFNTTFVAFRGTANGTLSTPLFMLGLSYCFIHDGHVRSIRGSIGLWNEECGLNRLDQAFISLPLFVFVNVSYALFPLLSGLSRLNEVRIFWFGLPCVGFSSHSFLNRTGLCDAWRPLLAGFACVRFLEAVSTHNAIQKANFQGKFVFRKHMNSS